MATFLFLPFDTILAKCFSLPFSVTLTYDRLIALYPYCKFVDLKNIDSFDLTAVFLI